MFTTEALGSPSSLSGLVQLSRTECLRLLSITRFGRVVVTVGAEHRPLIRPVSYLFDELEQAVTFRTAPGTKLHALLHSSVACFEIDGIDFEARTGWSVIVYGTPEAVIPSSQIRRLESAGLDSFAPGPEPAWIRVRATMVTGVRLEPPAAV